MSFVKQCLLKFNLKDFYAQNWSGLSPEEQQLLIPKLKGKELRKYLNIRR